MRLATGNALECRQEGGCGNVVSERLRHASAHTVSPRIGKALEGQEPVSGAMSERMPCASNFLLSPQDGHTPLIMAAQWGHKAVVAALLKANANPTYTGETKPNHAYMHTGIHMAV